MTDLYFQAFCCSFVLTTQIIWIFITVITSVEVTYSSFASARDATSYALHFLFLFLIWLHTKHFSCLNHLWIFFWFWRWRCCVVVITSTQLHSAKPELRFRAGSTPACNISEICDGENLWQWSQLEISLNAPRWSNIPQKQFNSPVVVMPTGVSLKILSPKTSRLHWLYHIGLLLLRDSHETFLTLHQTKLKFLYYPSLCVFHFSVEIFIASIPAAIFSFPVIYFLHK